MSSANERNPASDGSRAADNTASIHQVIAFIYGTIGVVMLMALWGTGSWGAGVILALVLGAITALHAALAAGARRRSDAAKAGSVLVGALMLLAFPIGTLVGGFLIYNATRNWPPRSDPHGPEFAPASTDLRSL